ncbi:uncharacterized protein B0P05DRAFT_527991 [Gilbertella persicaria]|uniref:Uncharacterized protein n=1 Tax=Rhizopus stolonifer TaxID=4846 RepID=A0A367KQV9_RHIST|nr:uncharacterized protein B0P05DRAFT_527991 [Gilbertella persicaria]KAI8090924.1 hypothetical protein B0P05DRAFT_527991 [Gilbertella persicaria]RCI04561.1 hypothetical protein CU098_012809 [Rhizopus stolonifer]
MPSVSTTKQLNSNRFSLVNDSSRLQPKTPLSSLLYPNGLSLRTRIIGQKQHSVDISFRTTKELEEALNKEFILHDRRIQVNRIFEKDSTIVRVGISNIPFEDEVFFEA